MVKSISYSQAEIIQDILSLYVPNRKIDCDPTYGKGNFYRDTDIQQPQYVFDIQPQADRVVQADCRHLPIAPASLNCVMFDPPFLATSGKSLASMDHNNIITKRFGFYPSEKELHQFYIDSMAEFYRILDDDGILIFKCQDKTSSGKQYMSHVFIMNEAVKIGFYPLDLFVLLAKNRLTAQWQTRNQKHARKYHCYFWVFQKCGRKIEYI